MFGDSVLLQLILAGVSGSVIFSCFVQMTAPGCQLPNGQSYAARLCHTWGLHLQATKYTISAIYSILKVCGHTGILQNLAIQLKIEN